MTAGLTIALADRYRIDLPGSTQNFDTYMAGVMYSFR